MEDVTLFSVETLIIRGLIYSKNVWEPKIFKEKRKKLSTRHLKIYPETPQRNFLATELAMNCIIRFPSCNPWKVT
ncbi:hypothetical protein TNCT_666631 [Trichonephila clavata]|uniref:Uncharacterized protein n=1 Tax=Trichonephila clavata TaxID=2740835 RepID=A0A8X6G2U4_TRICU|nr:hypothetical protein TNCT_666631 [Trichonephila clavata]